MTLSDTVGGSLVPTTDSVDRDRDETTVGDGPASVTVTVGVRSLSDEVQPLLDETLARLERATAVGTVDEVRVEVWGRSYDPLSSARETAAGRALSDRVAVIRRWANSVGASLGPYFEAEPVHCRLTGERYTRVQFPAVTLAVYRDGVLRSLAPCRVDEGHHDVLECAGELADGSVPLDTDGAGRPPTREAGRGDREPAGVPGPGDRQSLVQT